jgi:glycosyltransferase involved in cell wall biosynthesis
MGTQSPNVRVAIVGPLPPPAGGMAGQTQQLFDLLSNEGVRSKIVRTNAPYRPAFIGHVRAIRALFRLLPYLGRLWRATSRSTVLHVMANSGWSWHLFAAPAVWIGKLRGVRVIVNYRGGAAQSFLACSAAIVRPTLRMADDVVVPSEFLRAVFSRFGIAASVVPNVVDLDRFTPIRTKHFADAPHIIIARNLEAIYDVATGMRAFAILRAKWPEARLSIAGSGPERLLLETLAGELGISDSVSFCGSLSRDGMADLYRAATLMLNSSLVDNTPNSLLEAMACGVPIVSTNVGGIPYLVQDEVTALLVAPGEPRALAEAMVRAIEDADLRRRLVQNGFVVARRCGWDKVFPMWMQRYRPGVEYAADRPGVHSAGRG